MPDADPIYEQLTQLFAEKLQVDVPSIDTDLLEEGLLDSLSFVDLLLCLEREFGTVITLEDLELDNFRSVARIAAFVANRNGVESEV